jgi:hypothetical protein
MDCELARERLDVIHPEHPEQTGPDVQEAVAHVEKCAACVEVMENRRDFDREFGRVLRDVPVPPGLRSRLVLAVSEAASAESAAQRSPQRSATDPRRRRHMLTVLTAAAAGLLLVLGGWMMFGRREQAVLALDYVRDWCPKNLSSPAAIDALPPLDDSLNVPLLDNRWATLVGPTVPRGVDMDGDGVQDAAVYTVPRGQGAFLVVMGPGRIASPPAVRRAYYTRMAHAAWTVGERVYVVFVPDPNGQTRLDSLLNYVYGPVG